MISGNSKGEHMDILDKFIENAQKTLEEGYYSAGHSQETERKSLRKTIDANDFSLIAEIKHASPAGDYEFEYRY